jgi:hypothetical protein
MGGQAKNETPLASIFSETTLKNTKKLDFLFFMVFMVFMIFMIFMPPTTAPATLAAPPQECHTR